MNNINSINPITISQQKAGIVQNSQEQLNQAQAQNHPNNQNILPQTHNINPSLMYNFQIAKMDNEAVLKYLQSLLNIPNSIEKFINLLSQKNIDPKTTSILIENTLNIKALNEFLNKNSTEAISRLMQEISSSLKAGINDISQLKELLNVLNSIQSNTNLNTNTLKEFLLLYIPLNHQIFDKEAEINNINKEEKESIKNSKLSILFETINFSNILCSINEQENSIFLDIYTTKNFPNRNFQKIVLTSAKELNIVPLIDFRNTKEKVNSTNQNFKIISNNYISSNILILSHIIIKAIFKIDNDFSETI